MCRFISTFGLIIRINETFHVLDGGGGVRTMGGGYEF